MGLNVDQDISPLYLSNYYLLWIQVFVSHVACMHLPTGAFPYIAHITGTFPYVAFAHLLTGALLCDTDHLRTFFNRRLSMCRKLFAHVRQPGPFICTSTLTWGRHDCVYYIRPFLMTGAIQFHLVCHVVIVFGSPSLVICSIDLCVVVLHCVVL